MGRILFLTSRFPYPAIGGDKVRAARILERLARSHDVTLVSFLGPHDRAPDDVPPGLADCRLVRHDRLSAGIEGLRAAGQGAGLPLQVGFFRSDAMHRAVADVVATGPIDLVWVHLLRMAQYVPDLPDVPRVLDLTDCVSRACDRLADARGAGLGALAIAHALDAPAMRACEASAIGAFDRCLVVAESERQALAGVPGADRIRVVGNGVDRIPFGTNAIRSAAPEVLFLGALRTLPNRDAADWLARDVLPGIVRRAGPVRLSIVGAEPPRSVRALGRLPGVRVVGGVSDARPWLLRASVVACPMRLGAGVQNKVLEALAAGAPVVATPLAVEGLGDCVDGRVAIGEGTEGLADAVAGLLRDPDLRGRTGRAGFDLAGRLSWDRQLAPIDDVLDSLGVRARSDAPRRSRAATVSRASGPAVVVTGAGGFVGGAIARGLVSAGIDVRGWYRSTHPFIAGVSWTRVDLSDPCALPDLSGVSAVVHAAGLATDAGVDPERVFDANVAATWRVLDAALSGGVPRFLLCSTVKVLGPEALRAGTYGASKHDAEALVRDWAFASGGSAVLLRIAPVLGPGSRGDLGRIARLARLGVSIEPDRSSRRSISSPAVVADAVLRMVREPVRPGCLARVIADPVPVALRDVARTAMPGGEPLLRIRIPSFVLGLLARIGDAAGRFPGVRAPFDSHRLAELSSDAVFERNQDD